VVLFPALLALIFITGQAGLYFYARSVALAAAQEGARAGAMPSAATGAGDQAARVFLDRAGSDLVVGRVVSASRSAVRVSVTVSGRSLSLVPGYPGFPVSQTASAPVERVT
jgi:Flp pilus assembly protein TadG